MFIEVRKGLRVEAKHIEAVEEVDALNSIIYTPSRTFNVAMPYDVIASMIESRTKSNSNSMTNVEKLLHQIYEGQTAPAW